MHHPRRDRRAKAAQSIYAAPLDGNETTISFEI